MTPFHTEFHLQCHRRV